MRELFDEVAGQSPFDPEEAVRRATRVPQRKRFYTDAGTAEMDSGFAVHARRQADPHAIRPSCRRAYRRDRGSDRG